MLKNPVSFSSINQYGMILPINISSQPINSLADIDMRIEKVKEKLRLLHECGEIEFTDLDRCDLLAYEDDEDNQEEGMAISEVQKTAPRLRLV